MPQFLEPTLPEFSQPTFAPKPEEKPAPTWGETFEAGFGMENDIVAAVDLMQRKAFPKQPSFDLVESLKTRNLLERGEEFVGVNSDAELDDRYQRIVKEEKYRDTLTRAGWAGLAAQVGAGAVSPTMFFPLLRGATGVKAIATGALSVAAGAAAQEAVLFANQETRTRGEVAFSLAASTMLGGILGGVVHSLAPKDFDRMVLDMVRSPGKEAISPPVPFTHESSAGARELIKVNDAGSLKNGWGAKSLAWLSPVTRGFEQWNAPRYIRDAGGSSQVRKMTGGFSQSSLTLRQNAEGIAASPGGNVEDLKKTYAAISLAGRKAVDDTFNEYVLGSSAKGVLKKERAIMAAARDPQKLNYNEFKEAITKALWAGIPEGTDPAIAKAAKKIDAEVYKPLYDEAVEVGIFTGDEELVGDMGYANRIYKHEAIISRRNEFVNILANNYAKQLEQQFSEGVEKLTGRQVKDRMLIEDMQRTADEVRALRDELTGKLAALDEESPTAVTDAVTESKLNKAGIAQNNQLIKELQKGPKGETPEQAMNRLAEIDKLKAWNKRHEEAIKKAEAAAGEDLQKYLVAKKEIDQRLNSLKKAHGLVEERLAKKLEKIEANEELQISTIMRASKQLQRFYKFLDKTDDKVLDKEIEKLKGQFNEAGERLDKVEEELGKLEAEGVDVDVTVKGSPAAREALNSFEMAEGEYKLITKNRAEEKAQLNKLLAEKGNLYTGTILGTNSVPDALRRTVSKAEYKKLVYKAFADKYAAADEAWAKAQEKYKAAGSPDADAAFGTPDFVSAVDGTPPEVRLAEKQDRISTKMDELSAKIENFESVDREAIRADVDSMMRDLVETHQKINAKRAERNAKLWKQVENMSPEARAKRLEKVKAKAAAREPEFVGRWQGKASDIDLVNGKADFTEHAKQSAADVVEKILGTERRLAYSDIIQSKRGPELARLLNISSNEIADFLETDIEKQIAIYTRTLGSDISIARVFGSPDAAEEFAKLTDERQAMLDQIEAMTTKDGQPLPKEQKEKLQRETFEFYMAAQKDLQVLLERAKGIRGLPKDPDAWSTRAARTALDLNYLRYMGGVVISSVADPARVIMRHGLTRTFRDGILPMITNWKTIRMSQREAQLSGTALDSVMHTRMYALSDIFDDSYRGTIAERGIHYMSTRLGQLALFDQWNSAIKQFSAGVINAEFMDAIALVNGEKGSAKAVKKAQEFLARNNIDEEIAQTIWREVTNGEGGGKINGVWLPNTESWNVADPAVARARRAYRAALAGEVDATIITPGFERPNWVDMNVPARMIGQFRSFGFSSTQKTLMAGLQEHDAAFLNGAIASLGLGMLSYYLWATAVGGDAYKEMLDAPVEKWADEAITRSGLTGIFDELQRTAQRIPAIRDYASFSGTRSTRREGGDLVEGFLGPSFDLLDKGAGFVSGMDEPTQQTIHLLRQMLPFQNLFYFRQLLDKVEQSTGLPERRTQ